MRIMLGIKRRLLVKCGGLYSFSLAALVLLAPLLAPLQRHIPGDRSPVRSIKALRAHIDELRAKQDQNAKDDGLDYFEALEAYLSVRAYPYDSVDWNALRRAVE